MLKNKFKEWASNKWNLLDGVAVVSFFVGLGLRLHPTTRSVGHVVYCLDVALWIMRVLDIFSVSEHMGPYVVMIGRMVMTHFIILRMYHFFVKRFRRCRLSSATNPQLKFLKVKISFTSEISTLLFNFIACGDLHLSQFFVVFLSSLPKWNCCCHKAQLHCSWQNILVSFNCVLSRDNCPLKKYHAIDFDQRQHRIILCGF